jgi:glutathione S-transferase
VESQSPSSIAVVSEALAVLPRLTLYGHPGTRSPLVNWACHELGIMNSWVDEAADLSQNPHPFGQLPCLVASRRTVDRKSTGDGTSSSGSDEGDDGEVIFESGAILQYLYLLYVQHRENGTMAGSSAVTSPTGSILSWIAWANASLDPVCFLETPQGKVYDTGLRADTKNRKLRRLDNILSRQPYLLGDEFTVADVAVASYLLYVVQFFPDVDLTPWPAIKSYMKACASRPSYRKAFGDRVASYLVERLA